MSEKDKINTSHIDNPDVQHEKSDVRVKPIILFAVYLTVAAAIIHVMIYLLFNYFEDRERTEQAPRSPLAAERQQLPPAPRLQLAPSKPGQDKPDLKEHPLEELKVMRAEEEAALDNYVWVDEQAGTVRLPIKRAKELLLEKGGLPARPQSEQAPDEGQSFFSDSSGGTVLVRRK
jgi:hypothetical protein